VRFVHFRKQKAQKTKSPEKLSLSNRVDHIIQHCIKDEELPKGVITFLEKVWKNVMLKAYLDKYSSSEKRGRSTAFISSLIFSIKPATNSVEVSRLEQLIPVINNELDEGFEEINCPAPVREKCTRYLNKLHQAALTEKTATTQEKSNTSIVEEEIIYRNELFDDGKTSSQTVENLSREKEEDDELTTLELPAIHIEPQTKTVSSLEDAFIEDASVEEPSASEEPSSDKESSSSKESSTSKEPSANKEPSASNKPSASQLDHNATTEESKKTEPPKLSINKLLTNNHVIEPAQEKGNESKTDFELIRLVNHSYKLKLVDDEYTALAKTVREDTWLEFRFKTHFSRAQVSWLEDDHSQINCLTQNNRIIEMSLEALSDSFRQGICSLLKSDSIIDEAIKAISEKQS